MMLSSKLIQLQTFPNDRLEVVTDQLYFNISVKRTLERDVQLWCSRNNTSWSFRTKNVASIRNVCRVGYSFKATVVTTQVETDLFGII